jgi:single-strand DNA-binding protein
MMPALNKVQLIGRLGKEPEQHKTPKGSTLSVFSLAVDRIWRSKGETKKDTDWFNVEAWGKLGEICQKYLQKGQLIYVEGALRTTKYVHEGETRYFTKVIARKMQMLEWKEKGEEPVVEEEEATEEPMDEK